jgi:hypothetical protein
LTFLSFAAAVEAQTTTPARRIKDNPYDGFRICLLLLGCF